jgi:WD40 repeat protein
MENFFRIVRNLFAWLSFVSFVCLWFNSSARAADKITYQDHVLPILRDKCLGCHNQDKKSGGLRLNTFTNLIAGGSSGEVVKAGDPDSSPLYLQITHKREPFMPPKSEMLAKESLDTIRQWIAGGALETTGSKAIAANMPKLDIALKSISKGKPDGPPPMPSDKLTLDPVVQTARANALTALAASPWAPLVAVGGQKQVLLYHTETLDLLGVLPFPEGVPQVLKFSRNGSLLLAGGGRGAKSGRAVVWSVTTGERIFEVGEEFDAVLAADISADQTQIALGGPSKVVRVYSTKDGKLLHEIKKHTDWIYALEYSPDGVLLASADRNGGLFVWEAHTGREFFSLRGHTAAITDVSWRADSNVLASASEDGTIRLWEMENGNAIKNWAHGGPVSAVKFAHDGRLVSCGRDRVTKLWDQNGAQQRAFEAFPDVALRAAVSHDGSRVIAGDWTGQIRVWTTADGKVAGNLLANPPGTAEQFEKASKELIARKAAYDQLATAASASQAAAQKAATDLTAAQQAVANSAAAIKEANEAVAKAKAAVDQANARITTAQGQVAAKEILSKALAEAAAKVQEAAGKDKANPELTKAADKAREIAAQAAADLTGAQKSVADLTAAAKTAADQLAAAQKKATETTATAAAAPNLVKERTAQAQSAAAKAAAAKAAADQAAATLAATAARVDKWKSAMLASRKGQK